MVGKLKVVFVVWTATSIALARLGGLYFVTNAMMKRSSMMEAKIEAKRLGLQKGDLVLTYGSDKAFPYVGKKFLTDVSIWQVVSIKNRNYKMRYLGSRTYTDEEIKHFAATM